LRDDREALRHARLEDLLHAGETGRDVQAGHTTGVERAHRQLRARLTDGLRRDDADGDTFLDEPPGRQRATVAALADAALRLAGERGAHERLLDAGLDDALRQLLGDLLVRTDDDLAGVRVGDRR